MNWNLAAVTFKQPHISDVKSTQLLPIYFNMNKRRGSTHQHYMKISWFLTEAPNSLRLPFMIWFLKFFCFWIRSSSLRSSIFFLFNMLIIIIWFMLFCQVPNFYRASPEHLFWGLRFLVKALFSFVLKSVMKEILKLKFLSWFQFDCLKLQ